MLDLTQAKLDVLRLDARGVGSGFRDHRGCHVHPENTTRGPDLLGGEEAVEPGSAAEVEHGFAGPEGCNRLGVAAAEAQVRPLGDGRELLCGVAELLARVRVRTAAAGNARPFPCLSVAFAYGGTA